MMAHARNSTHKPALLSWRISREWRVPDTGSQGSAQVARRKDHLQDELAAVARPHGVTNDVGGDLAARCVMGDARRLDEPSKNLEELCSQLLAIGVPLDRVVISISTLHSEHDAVARVWLKGEGITERTYVSPGPDDPRYLNSPLHASFLSREWVELRLADTPDDLFGIVPDLKAQGYTHYICVPIIFANDLTAWANIGRRARMWGFPRATLPSSPRSYRRSRRCSNCGSPGVFGYRAALVCRGRATPSHSRRQRQARPSVHDPLRHAIRRHAQLDPTYD